MTTSMNVTVTGVGIALPGVRTPTDLLNPEPSGPVDPGARIGRKGLRYKDRATQLAYVVAHDALHDAGLLVDGELTVPHGQVAVVASSNFGNVDTITDTVQTIATETAAATSPMLLPNASSNVVASSVAIKFGLQGPNLMLCNGETSGLDAVFWATTLIASGRAEQALVIGVEPDNPAVRRLTGAEGFDGAVALVLETQASAEARAATPRATIGDYTRASAVDVCLSKLGDRPAAWYSPRIEPGDLLEGVSRVDLSEKWGIASGSLGVLQCVASIGWFEHGGAGPVYAVTGDASDGVAGQVLWGPHEH
jgi:3-oxoacyl-[acyl-carrier-protein] synthase II